MVGRRQAGRMRRSNRRLFLDEVQLHRATLLRKPVNLLFGTSSAACALQTLTPPPTARVSPREHSPNPHRKFLLLLYPSYQFAIFARFRYLFVIGPLTNAAQYDVIESLSLFNSSRD